MVEHATPARRPERVPVRGEPRAWRPRPSSAHTTRLRHPRLSAAAGTGPRPVAGAALERARGRPGPRGRALPRGPRAGRQRVRPRLRDAGPRDLDRGSGAARALRPGRARRVAQSPLDRAGLELRHRDARGPLLLEPARPPHGHLGLDSVRGGERGPRAAADHVLVAPRASRGEPARQVPATLPAAMARAAEPGRSPWRPRLRPPTAAAGRALQRLFRLRGGRIERLDLENQADPPARARLVAQPPTLSVRQVAPDRKPQPRPADLGSRVGPPTERPHH